MLKELGVFVEALQRELELHGCKPTDIQVDIKCQGLVEWAVLDQAVERDIKAEYPPGFAGRRQPYDRMIVPHLLIYKHTPVRITYER